MMALDLEEGMNRRARVVGLACGLATALGALACVHVDIKEDAQAVSVVTDERAVADCKKRGEITARTTAGVGFIRRGDTTVALELERIARNDAVGLEANTIRPLGPVSAEGQRRYAAYRCPI